MTLRNRFVSLLTGWPFLLSLGTLLLNDSWLKSAAPGWVTGKLSDFAGIAVVAMLLLAFAPQRRRWVFAGLSLFFLWWKSPASADFIAFFNAHAPYRIGRVVDYTDLMALMVLPLADHAVRRAPRYALPWSRARRVLLVPVVAATLLGVMGTSSLKPRQQYSVRPVDANVALDRQAVNAAIATVTGRHGMKCTDCSDMQKGAEYEGNEMRLLYAFKPGNSAEFQVISYRQPGIFFGSDGQKEIEALRDALKQELRSKVRGLEYVEALERN